MEALTTRSARRTIPFVGRASELTILRDGFARVARHAVGRCWSPCSAKSGIGKSRLADEFVAGLDTDVHGVGRPQPRSHSDTRDVRPDRHHGRATLAGIDGGEPPDEGPEAPAGAGRSLARRGRRGGRGRSSAWRCVLGVAEGRHEESAFVQDVRAGFLALVDGLAGERSGRARVRGRAHCSRPPMLDLIERLAARAQRGPGGALILALGATGAAGAATVVGVERAERMMLRLGPALRPMRPSSWRGRPAADASTNARPHAIAARAGGNPFFIVETTGMLLTGASTAPAGGPSPLPPTVQAVVASRLDSLPRVAARSGPARLGLPLLVRPGRAARLVAPMRHRGAAAARGRGDRGARRGQPGTPGAGPRWRLRHATLRDVAYASLPKRERLRAAPDASPTR